MGIPYNNIRENKESIKLEKESDKKMMILLESIWNCPKHFTKEQLNEELNKNEMVLNDFEAVKLLCKDFLFEDDGLYHVNITDVFNKMYKKL